MTDDIGRVACAYMLGSGSYKVIYFVNDGTLISCQNIKKTIIMKL